MDWHVEANESLGFNVPERFLDELHPGILVFFFVYDLGDIAPLTAGFSVRHYGGVSIDCVQVHGNQCVLVLSEVAHLS